MPINKLWIILLLFLLNACQGNKPDIAPEQKEQIDSIFADWKGYRPGGAIGVIQNAP